MTSGKVPRAILLDLDDTIGGHNWFEFVCDDCRCYTEYEHTWG